jgi:hypothetical protein
MPCPMPDARYSARDRRAQESRTTPLPVGLGVELHDCLFAARDHVPSSANKEKSRWG